LPAGARRDSGGGVQIPGSATIAAARMLLVLTFVLGLLGCPTGSAVHEPAQDSQLEQPAQEEQQLLDTEEQMEPESQPDDGSFED
jgi:hypothetical protein